MQKNDEIIQISNLGKNYGMLEVFDGISLSVNRGEVVAVLGPSGSGKSTMLRCINLLEIPDRGEIIVDGKRITGKLSRKEVNELRTKVGMVFQHFNLFPHMTVLQNITYAPRKVLKQSNAEAERNARRLLAQVGLESKADTYPSKISGGQKQRVAIARALAMNPDVLLFDEPTSALDPEMVKEVLNVIRSLADSGITMMIVTHEIGFAKQVADKICFVDHGQGTVYTPAEEFFSNCKSERARRFLEQIM